MKTNTTMKVIGLILALAVIVFGGIGLTGAAAQSAIPGDALYPVKTTIEKTRLSLAQDAGDRAQMKLAFADQRLSEINGLIREGRYREIREAVLSFEASINAAILELETVSAADPARAAVIAQEVTAALTRYAQMLSELAAVAPDSVKPEVNRALDTTHIASGLGQIKGNENSNANENGNVNVNGNDNDSRDDSNRNANVNANDNGSRGDDDNRNANVNANDKSRFDDNSNQNSSANVNGGNSNSGGGDDDKSNSNTNMNANDNSRVEDNANRSTDDNTNTNINSNTNTNSNDNGSDDSSNRNSNDNGDDDSGKGRGRGKDD